MPACFPAGKASWVVLPVGQGAPLGTVTFAGAMVTHSRLHFPPLALQLSTQVFIVLSSSVKQCSFHLNKGKNYTPYSLLKYH